MNDLLQLLLPPLLAALCTALGYEIASRRSRREQRQIKARELLAPTRLACLDVVRLAADGQGPATHPGYRDAMQNLMTAWERSHSDIAAEFFGPGLYDLDAMERVGMQHMKYIADDENPQRDPQERADAAGELLVAIETLCIVDH